MYERELSFMLKTIKKCGVIAKKGATSVTKKSKHDYVTDKDLIVEAYLIREIKKKFPSDRILSEESSPLEKLKNRIWIIDPIDGTLNYMSGNPNWCIQMAFYDEGEIKASVVYLPEFNKTIHAVKGQGAYINNKKIILNLHKPLDTCLINMPTYPIKNFQLYIALMQGLINAGAKIRSVGSSGVEITGILYGYTDVNITLNPNIWDYAPGDLILSEAGGVKLTRKLKTVSITVFALNEEIANNINAIIEKCFRQSNK